MKANFKLRFRAYVIDLMVLMLIFMLIYFFIPENANNQKLQVELNTLNENFIKEEMNIKEYLNNYGVIMYNLDKNNILYLYINIIVTTIYFIILPYFFKGKTFGKYLLNIKVKTKNKEITIPSLIIRNLIINGLLYLIGNVFLLLLFKDNTYFILLVILGIIQIILSITSVFMVIYRKDCRGLHDILSKTTVLRGE